MGTEKPGVQPSYKILVFSNLDAVIEKNPHCCKTKFETSTETTVVSFEQSIWLITKTTNPDKKEPNTSKLSLIVNDAANYCKTESSSSLVLKNLILSSV